MLSLRTILTETSQKLIEKSFLNLPVSSKAFLVRYEGIWTKYTLKTSISKSFNIL